MEKNPLLIITGASRGIGLATVEQFLAQGYRVINLSRSAPKNSAIEHWPVDLSHNNWVDAVQAELSAAAASADHICLIHNAGLLHNDSVHALPNAQFAEVLQVNVMASVQLNQLLLPSMKAGSSILYVGSTLSEKAVANSCSYVVSKHAVLGLMRATCQDLVGAGVHTACICPGFTETEMLLTHIGHDQGIRQAIAEGVAFKRLIEPAEIANTLWFAAQNPVINGAVLHANLGQIER